ncbi:MAG: ATP-dependent Clp protease ATP-binding subunit [Clostridiales bacterium]|jgi:ATP-dependent Clp protease ATP-binding subunit ClpE|nr:ATP-dependent Clp protease ATP-binding subunit [Clostridiales bacterium]
MLKCSICKINYAVVFVTRIINGVQTQEGLCLSCAKKQGIQPLDTLIDQMGMTDEDVEALTNQMGSIFGEIGQGDGADGGDGDGDADGDADGEAAIDGDRQGQGGRSPALPGRSGANAGGGGGGGGGNPAFRPGGAGKSGGRMDLSALLNAAFRGGDGHAGDRGGERGMPPGQLFALTQAPQRGGGSGDDKSGGKADSKTKTQEKKQPRKKKYLDVYGANLTDLAAEGGIDRVIGRQQEIDRVIQILNRRMKNNPILIGEPGVGKTAIAEGLAVRICSKAVPAKLYNYEVYRIDMTTVIAGTQFRGQFESRLKGIIEEAKSFSNIILVIDEIHNLMGAGDADGAMNAANILKPALARGEIQVVGATTLKEYRKHIERDQALERRFQPVLVDEPSVEDTIEILKGIRDYYESYHKVTLPDEVLEAAAKMSERYISDRFLPDKAIDVIDEAGSRCNLRNNGLVELEALKAELKAVQEEKDYAISVDSIEDYQKAADLKVRECKLLDRIKVVESLYLGLEVTLDDVAQVIEAWTKIPVKKLTQLDTERLMSLEERIHRRIVGQHEAVEAVCRSIRRSRSGFRKVRKPASFIFVGPTGVGKTELVKALAQELFDSEEALIRLDMSEYMEKHTVSKLIGSPPGYIGYDDAGQLTEKVRRKPYSIILLDEIEKAHPEVFNILLQILDDGRLTDSQGRVVNFENTVLIMTSNAGTSFKSASIGFGGSSYANMENRVNAVLKEIFKPEFINRVDSVAVFKELQPGELADIIRLMLDEVVAEAAEMGVALTYDAAALPEWFLSREYQKNMGARPFRREIQKKIEDVLSEMYIKGDMRSGDALHVAVAGGELTFAAASGSDALRAIGAGSAGEAGGRKARGEGGRKDGGGSGGGGQGGGRPGPGAAPPDGGPQESASVALLPPADLAVTKKSPDGGRPVKLGFGFWGLGFVYWGWGIGVRD